MSSFRRYLTKTVSTLREDGAAVLARKALRNLQIRSRRLVSPYHYRNVRRWKELKGAFRGQRGFLIGNGPSLNVTPLHLLEGEKTLAFNRFNLMYERLRWRPTMYMNIDSAVVVDMATELHGIIEDVPYAFFPDIHNDGIPVRQAIGDAENIYWLYPAFSGFNDDLPNFGLGGTVAFPGLQTLMYLGLNPIYMIGVDVTYRIHETAVQDGTAIRSQADDDPNHFDARYFGAGRRYHQPDPIAIAKMRKAFAVAADAARERKISVINAGIGGQLELFPRVDFRSLFGANRGEQWERDALRSSASAVGLSIPDAAFTATPVSEPAAGLSSAGLFALMPQDTLRWAPKLTNTHIPFGPLHDGRSIFVPRMSAAQSTVRSAASVR